jgi:hypothetical protein
MGIVYEEKNTSCGIEMRLGNFLEVGIKTTMTTMNFCVLTNLKMA